MTNIGYDAGRYAVKALAGERQTIFPAYAVPYQVPLLDVGLGATPDVLVGWDGHVWTVGEGAVRQGDGTRPETAAWIETPEYLACFRRAITDVTVGPWVACNIVAGLPIGDYRRDSEKLHRILLPAHTFRRNGEIVTVQVEHLRIVPQAWGAVLALLLNPDGSIADASLLEQHLAIVDIGGHTVNLLTVKSLSDIPSESVSLNAGAWDVMRQARQFLTGLGEGYADLNDHEIMRACVLGRIWNGNAGEWVDLRDCIQPVLARIGTTVMEAARTFWHGGEAFDKLLLIGGGAYLWADTILAAFPQVVVLEEPETANARGFRAFAEYLEHERLWKQD